MVLEVTFQIVLLFMIKYGWIGEIINVETAFYRETDKEIYLKIPTELDIVTGDKCDSSDCLILLIQLNKYYS